MWPAADSEATNDLRKSQPPILLWTLKRGLTKGRPSDLRPNRPAWCSVRAHATGGEMENALWHGDLVGAIGQMLAHLSTF